VNKTHVQHTIRLVEHEHLHIVQVDVALVHQIDQAPRRRHEDIGLLAERGDLTALRDPA
jgi:hypothetical protein